MAAKAVHKMFMKLAPLEFRIKTEKQRFSHLKKKVKFHTGFKTMAYNSTKLFKYGFKNTNITK